MTPAETAANTIASHQMLSPGDRVLVAFSGGADSTATALLLRELGYHVVLGHVDHGMRPSSVEDARHCEQMSRRLGVPFLLIRVSVDPPTQAQARLARYEALQKMALDCRADRIATGHTVDDQAETVVLRLERGGYGLGIPPIRGNIIRPILDLRRSETESVCRRLGVAFCSDPSNLNPSYRRVQVRTRLAAATEGELARLNALAVKTRAEADQISLEIEQLWPQVVTAEPGQVAVDRRGMAHVPDPVLGQLIRRAAAGLGLELTGRVVRDIVGKVLPVTGARLALAADLWVWSERDRVVFGRPEQPHVLPRVELQVPGITALVGWSAELEVEFLAALEPGGWSSDRSSELVDAAMVPAGLSVRQWQPGDRFRPLGAPGSRKLQDFFVDAGIPRAVRHSVPIIFSGNDIVWVGGHRLDDRFKVRAGTTEVLRLTLVRAPREEVA